MSGEKIVTLVCPLLVAFLAPAGGAHKAEFRGIIDFEKGTEEEVLSLWHVPDLYESTVTRLGVAVVLVEDGTARVLRIDHDVRQSPSKAMVETATASAKSPPKTFESLAVRFRGLKRHTFFRPVLLDSKGNQIVGPLLQAGPVHWDTQTVKSSEFAWPEDEKEDLRGIAFLIDKKDGNQKGTLLIRWVGWR